MAETYEVSFDSELKVDFGATGTAEILQNVAMILASTMYSCPMARAFAWDGGLLDRPINVVKSLLAARLITAITTYEPRVEVLSVSYDGSLNGTLKPMVKVRIKENG
ncbi:hypothetical protein [Anaeroselena agilis]|uniref:IraD/Gp25-like domain-containing protein n=1 Tax=Anaeroselena agilis TaxID=3063788 RepID=A0ABU3NYE7_9FIRM|nr:hypothetical protein [Selenomonadales bacterium 4137-cl]